jgi:coenzyme PQQ precursor peptide PqqA
MKIMSLDSWSRGRRRPARRANFSIGWQLRLSAGPAETPESAIQLETCMTWETPTATDFRFGFEITMYIAAR